MFVSFFFLRVLIILPFGLCRCINIDFAFSAILWLICVDPKPFCSTQCFGIRQDNGNHESLSQQDLLYKTLTVDGEIRCLTTSQTFPVARGMLDDITMAVVALVEMQIQQVDLPVTRGQHGGRYHEHGGSYVKRLAVGTGEDGRPAGCQKWSMIVKTQFLKIKFLTMRRTIL